MRVPNFKEPGLTDFLNHQFGDVDRKLTTVLSKITANHSVLLQSPAGKVYEITVNDAGTLVATLVADV